MIQIVTGTRAAERIVVGASMFFQVRREIEAGLFEESFADEVKRDQESPDAAVAVEERVDRFELIMTNRNTHKVRHMDR